MRVVFVMFMMFVIMFMIHAQASVHCLLINRVS